MSIVKTTEQARGLQRCSTHGCVCCDRRGRCFGAPAIIERWHLIGDDDRPNFGWRAHGFDGPAMLRSDGKPLQQEHARTCAKHQCASGVFPVWIPAIREGDEATQMNRVILGATFS